MQGLKTHIEYHHLGFRKETLLYEASLHFPSPNCSIQKSVMASAASVTAMAREGSISWRNSTSKKGARSPWVKLPGDDDSEKPMFKSGWFMTFTIFVYPQKVLYIMQNEPP